jgi:hypothetical protein
MSIKLSTRSILFIILFIALNVTASAATIYVNNQAGLDSYNGLSRIVGTAPSGPKFSIAGAIAAAANGDTISVAYTGLAYGDLNANGKTLFFNTSSGALYVQGDVNVSGITFTGSVLMMFTGSNNQTFTVPSVGTSISALTINKATGSLIISGGDLTCTGTVTFMSGLVKTGTNNALVLTNTGGTGTAKGYVRNLTIGAVSHVVGNVKQNLQYSTLIAYARNEFPVGDTVNYRPVALAFLSTSCGNFGVFATVSHTNARPTGTAGLPITNGIADDADLSKYLNFYWSIKTDGTMGNTRFDIELTAGGVDTTQISLKSVGYNRVKIIRRIGISADIQNQWNLQGNRDSYDNVVNSGVPSVIAVNASYGLSPSGAIFTYGLVSPCSCLFGPVSLTKGGPAVTESLFKPINYFSGYFRPLTYSALTDTHIVTVTFNADTVIFHPISAGKIIVIINAVDVDGSQAQLFISVEVCNATVSGSVTYASITADPITGVTLMLTPMRGAALATTSSVTGIYSFANVSAGTYTLTASKTGNWGGVTGADALAVVRHAAGIVSLTGLPLQAADVNRNGVVSGADALSIVRRAAGLDTMFAAGDWMFTNQNKVVVSFSDTNVIVNFSGVCVGDVNASYTPASGTAFVKGKVSAEKTTSKN